MRLMKIDRGSQVGEGRQGTKDHLRIRELGYIRNGAKESHMVLP